MSTPETAEHQPYVPPSASPAELTLKAAGAGVLFGILFGAANAYLGLRAGLTISTSIPVAVMTVAAFRLLRRVGVRSTLLEANMSQTIGSASSSVRTRRRTAMVIFEVGCRPPIEVIAPESPPK